MGSVFLIAILKVSNTLIEICQRWVGRAKVIEEKEIIKVYKEEKETHTERTRKRAQKHTHTHC